MWQLRLRQFQFVVAFLSVSTCLVRCQTLNESVCTLGGWTHDLRNEAKQFGIGVIHIPRAMVRPTNVRWELPIAATTGVLIAEADRPADNRIQSQNLIQTASTWSNVGLGLELGSSAMLWGAGCHKHRSHASTAGFAALSAMGAAGTVDLALKLAFDRQFPSRNSRGAFWGGGRSFPSGHAATSFAFASAMAHYYAHDRWVKWSAYALATGVSLSRYPAKKHYLSDILVGGTIGYLAGDYVVSH